MYKVMARTYDNKIVVISKKATAKEAMKIYNLYKAKNRGLKFWITKED